MNTEHRAIGLLVPPQETVEAVNAHMLEHRLPCVDDKPVFFRYSDGCVIERLSDGDGLYFTPYRARPAVTAGAQL